MTEKSGKGSSKRRRDEGSSASASSSSSRRRDRSRRALRRTWLLPLWGSRCCCGRVFDAPDFCCLKKSETSRSLVINAAGSASLLFVPGEGPLSASASSAIRSQAGGQETPLRGPCDPKGALVSTATLGACYQGIIARTVRGTVQESVPLPFRPGDCLRTSLLRSG